MLTYAYLKRKIQTLFWGECKRNVIFKERPVYGEFHPDTLRRLQRYPQLFHNGDWRIWNIIWHKLCIYKCVVICYNLYFWYLHWLIDTSVTVSSCWLSWLYHRCRHCKMLLCHPSMIDMKLKSVIVKALWKVYKNLIPLKLNFPHFSKMEFCWVVKYF